VSVRTRRLGDSSVATAGSAATTTIFTVPSDRTAIVKDVQLAVTAATAPPVALILQINKADTTVRRVWTNSLNVGTFTPWAEPWIVLQEGDSLRVTQPANCTVQTYVSGTLLDGDPA
jgi:hypothetical protein